MNDLKCMCGVGMSGYCAVHKHGWAYQLPQQASQPDPKQYPLSSGARAAFEHGYAEGTKDSAPKPDPKDPAETFRQGWEAGCAERRDLLKQLREGAARFEELEKERDRLQKRVESAEAALTDASQRGDRWKAAAKKLRDERDRLAAELSVAKGQLDDEKHHHEYWKDKAIFADADCERLEAEAARMREALEWYATGGDGRSAGLLGDIKTEQGKRARQALASTTAGTLALGVIEAARKAAHEARMAKQPHIAELLERNLQAYDQATPHLINTDISCDQGGETPGGHES